MDSGKEAPAHPQVLFDDSSLIIGKAPLATKPTKIMKSSSLIGQREG